MISNGLKLILAAGMVAVGGCNAADQPARAEDGANGANAVKEAGDKTIGASLPADSRFLALTKAAGLDATLSGPGPYTVFVPDDAAFAKLPDGVADGWATPEARPELTRTLSYHILPGTVLAEDIANAIDAGDGKATLATMGGGTLTATKEGDRIILTDGAGAKSAISKADETLANGVVHHVDTVLMPGAAG